MTTAQECNVEDGSSAARLRPADGHLPRTASQVAGPFEVAADERKGATVGEALMAGLLVIYPAFAALVAIGAGLFLAGASGI